MINFMIMLLYTLSIFFMGIYIGESTFFKWLMDSADMQEKLIIRQLIERKKDQARMGQ